jgi:hypothetical protein
VIQIDHVLPRASQVGSSRPAVGTLESTCFAKVSLLDTEGQIPVDAGTSGGRREPVVIMRLLG